MLNAASIAVGLRKVKPVTRMLTPGDLPKVPKVPFFQQLDRLLEQHGCDTFTEELCRPSLPLGVYFRPLLPGLDSVRRIVLLAAESLSMRTFLGYGLHESTPDHSTLSRTRRLLSIQVQEQVFNWLVSGAAVPAGPGVRHQDSGGCHHQTASRSRSAPAAPRRLPAASPRAAKAPARAAKAPNRCMPPRYHRPDAAAPKSARAAQVPTSQAAAAGYRVSPRSWRFSRPVRPVRAAPPLVRPQFAPCENPYDPAAQPACRPARPAQQPARWPVPARRTTPSAPLARPQHSTLMLRRTGRYNQATPAPSKVKQAGSPRLGLPNVHLVGRDSGQVLLEISFDLQPVRTWQQLEQAFAFAHGVAMQEQGRGGRLRIPVAATLRPLQRSPAPNGQESPRTLSGRQVRTINESPNSGPSNVPTPPECRISWC